MRTAVYARYSSDSQREASLDDQIRNCCNCCIRNGWDSPAIFTDAAVSGSRSDREGYQRFLAEAHRFDVLLIDDLSRLSRDKDEIGRIVKRLTFHGVRLIGVSDGVDTQRKSHKVDVGMRGLMAELYLDDLAEKTHRGLTGRALAGASAGGLSYGYKVTETGQRAILSEQAIIVCRIFDEYIGGKSPRAIAAGLNAEDVPAPRGGVWAASAIRPDKKRGIGILANAIYVGEQRWNRSDWIKHPETGMRVRTERPREDWIVRQVPELAIIDRPTWDAAQQRAEGRTIAMPARKGRPARHLLSGVLRCGECGGPMVVVDRYRYGCARQKESGSCTNRIRFDRQVAEHALLAGVRSDLMTEEACRVFQREAVAAMKRHAPNTDALQRNLDKARTEHANLMKAIKAGIITRSTKAELEACERAISAAQEALAKAQVMQPARILPRAKAVWERLVNDIANHVRDVPAARKALLMLVGEEIVVRTNENGDPFAEIAGSTAEINVVAGAGFALSLTAAPIRIVLTASRAS